VTNGHGMMFVHLLPMMVIDICKVWSWRRSHAGGLIKSGVQGNTAAFAHFDFAAPLAFFAHAGVHAGIGQEAGFASCPRSESHSTVPRLQCS
jgi:hypothetical protein